MRKKDIKEIKRTRIKLRKIARRLYYLSDGECETLDTVCKDIDNLQSDLYIQLIAEGQNK